MVAVGVAVQSQTIVSVLAGGYDVIVGEGVSVGVGNGKGVNVREGVLDISAGDGLSTITVGAAAQADMNIP